MAKGRQAIIGPLVDFALIVVAAAVAEDVVQQWLWGNPQALYWGTSALHLFVLPVTVVVLMSPWSPAGSLIFSNQTSWLERLLVWSMVLYACAGFIVPVVMSLALKAKLGVMLGTLFGPYVLLALSMWILIKLDKRYDYALSREGAQPPKGLVPAVHVLLWLYLIFVETTLLVVSGAGGTLGAGPVLMMAVVLGYVPMRVFLWFLGPMSRLEAMTAGVAFWHLLLRISEVSTGPLL